MLRSAQDCFRYPHAIRRMTSLARSAAQLHRSSRHRNTPSEPAVGSCGPPTDPLSTGKQSSKRGAQHLVPGLLLLYALTILHCATCVNEKEPLPWSELPTRGQSCTQGVAQAPPPTPTPRAMQEKGIGAVVSVGVFLTTDTSDGGMLHRRRAGRNWPRDVHIRCDGPGRPGRSRNEQDLAFHVNPIVSAELIAQKGEPLHDQMLVKHRPEPELLDPIIDIHRHGSALPGGNDLMRQPIVPHDPRFILAGFQRAK